MRKRLKQVGVYWIDIKVYHDGGMHEPVPGYTEGELAVDHPDYVLIKNPETLLIDENRPHNHPEFPEKKIMFYYIPRGLITDIVNYEKGKKK